MPSINNLVKSLFVKGLGSSLFSFVQLLFLLITLLPFFFLKLWDIICALLKKKNFKEDSDNDLCYSPFPEEVFRRPDPCIYSQSYLQSQGLPVTWNNPDIFMAKKITPAVIEADSYHLESDTDYIVFVKVHNASTDLALGVKLRLLYREWSFNDPVFHPLAIDAHGNEIIKYINVEGMKHRIATFNWRTPKVPPGENKHYCLQAQVSHPLDTNPSNNVGQENTRVYGSTTSSSLPLNLLEEEITLFNHSKKNQTFTFYADAYQIIDDHKIALNLTRTEGHERWPLHKRIGNFMPTAFPVKGRSYKYRMQKNIPRKLIRKRYSGYQSYKTQLLESDFSLPPSISISMGDAKNSVRLGPGQTAKIPVSIQLPIESIKKHKKAINIQALTASGKLVGGVTYLLN